MITLIVEALGDSELDGSELLVLLRDIRTRSELRIKETDLLAAVAKLSPQARLRASEMLRDLKRRNRILHCRDYCSVCSQPEHFGCDTELRMTDVVLVGRGHYIRRKGSTTMNLSDYLTSSLQERLTATDIGFKSIESRERWEHDVLKPLGRFAQQIKLIDKIVSKNFEHFAPSIEWIIGAMRGDRNVPVILTTSEPASKSIREAISNWAKGRDVVLNYRYAMEHYRAISTDRLSLRVDQGLDLLMPDGRVRKSAIHVMKDLP